MNPLVLILCSEIVVLVIQRASEIPAPVIYRGFWYWRRNGVKAFEGTLFNQGLPGTHTHTRLTTLCSGLPRWAGTRKVEPIWILLKQETVSGSGINWAICKSAHRSPLSFFYRPDALPAAQPTVSKHWRNTWQWVLIKTIWLCKNLWHNWTVNDTDLWQIEYAVHVWFHSVVVAELLLRLPCHLACISWNSLPSCGHFPLHNSGRICSVSFFFWLFVLLLLNFRLSVQDIAQQPSSWLWKCLTVLIFLSFCDKPSTHIYLLFIFFSYLFLRLQSVIIT